MFGDLDEALDWKPDAVVIASISVKHAHELELCIQRGLPCLVEKPLVTSRSQLERLKSLLQTSAVSDAVVIGCNLRYLPALKKLRHMLYQGTHHKLLRAYFEVGQELSQWRPGRDLTSSYSASASSGGGVVFDLVHEVDMARWLLGPLQVRSAIGGHFSSLPIDSDDIHVALLKGEMGAPVVISLDYVSQQVVRKYDIVTAGGTFSVDIIAMNITFSDSVGRRVVTELPYDFDVKNTYRLQMMDWLLAVKSPDHKVLSPLGEALETAELMLTMQEAIR